ncbi:MAG: flagellar basal body P-ring formation protein FlgA [Candidatus Delongbacteria bacterium]|nr:flagellar basal body P-ring formation protein FlgA [Candidatus Delongbacteria bacterium]
MISKSLILWMLLVIQLQSSVLIYCKKEADRHDRLCLNDIAALAGRPVTNELKSAGLQSIVHQEYLLRSDLEQFIHHRFPTLQFRMFGPDTIRLVSRSHYFTQAELNRHVIRFIASRMNWSDSLIRITCKKKLDFSGLSRRVDSVSLHSIQTLRSGGISNLTLGLFHDTLCLASYRLPIVFTLLDSFLTVKEPLSSGIGVIDDLFTKTILPIKPGSRTPLKSVRDISGAVSRRPLQPGRLLYERDFIFPVIIKKNQPIDARYQINDLQLTAKLIALQDGKLGQIIRSMNPDSRQEVRVRITGSGKGEIVL